MAKQIEQARPTLVTTQGTAGHAGCIGQNGPVAASCARQQPTSRRCRGAVLTLSEKHLSAKTGAGTIVKWAPSPLKFRRKHWHWPDWTTNPTRNAQACWLRWSFSGRSAFPWAGPRSLQDWALRRSWTSLGSARFRSTIRPMTWLRTATPWPGSARALHPGRKGWPSRCVHKRRSEQGAGRCRAHDDEATKDLPEPIDPARPS